MGRSSPRVVLSRFTLPVVQHHHPCWLHYATSFLLPPQALPVPRSKQRQHIGHDLLYLLPLCGYQLVHHVVLHHWICIAVVLETLPPQHLHQVQLSRLGRVGRWHFNYYLHLVICDFWSSRKVGFLPNVLGK